jgi:ribosomal protein S18 acetylase RimI-like enzyme
MYECVNLNKKNMDKFKALSLIKSKFNDKNEDFFEFFSKCNFAQQIMARRKVKLIKHNEEYIGFIWYEYINKNTCLIKSMFSSELYNCDSYKILLDNIKTDSILQYNCKSNEINSVILKELGFLKKDGLLELSSFNFEFDKEEFNGFLAKNNLSFREFIKGKDENLRCSIQNQVFEDENRTPVSIHDIYFDESQNYYLETGAVFLYQGLKCIGYGQIIIEKNCPYIVNVGVLSEFRGLGYGRILMYHLLNIISENDFSEVRLKVKNSNYKALNLYKGLGFTERSEIVKWELKR